MTRICNDIEDRWGGKTPGAGDDVHYRLRLYTTGTTPASMRALGNIKRICEQHLPGRYQLEVIDLYQQPALAAREQIIAAPTLIKTSPLPRMRMIGDMSNQQRVLSGLNLSASA